MKLEVHTLRYGNPDYLPPCSATLEAWCERHRLPLRVWSEWDPSYPSSKFVEIDMLREFLSGESDHLLYVDADVIIRLDAPMIETAPGLCWRDDHPHGYRYWPKWMSSHFPAVSIDHWIYRNAGVWLCDRSAATAMLRHAKPPFFEGFMEQHQWNYWAMLAWRDGMIIHDLPPEWNCWESDRHGWFFHLTTKPKLARIEKLRINGVL